MIVKCINNDGRKLPLRLQLDGWGKIIEELTVGKNYVVYAIDNRMSAFWYLICDDYYGGSAFDYPKFFSSDFFEVVDSTSSKYWTSRLEIDNYDENKTEVENVGFLAMFDIPYFYGELVEGERQDIIDIFNRYRKMLNIESNNDKIAKALAIKVARFSMEK